MAESVAALTPRPKAARMRKVEQRTKSSGENMDKDREALLEKEKARQAELKKKRLSEAALLGQKGSFVDLPSLVHQLSDLYTNGLSSSP